jgi:hypothetical protein
MHQLRMVFRSLNFRGAPFPALCGDPATLGR